MQISYNFQLTNKSKNVYNNRDVVKLEGMNRMLKNMKKTAAMLLVLAACTAPAYAAESPKLADGELFVSDRVVKDGKVLYKSNEAHADWEHDAEAKVPGFVGTAFVPAAEKQQGTDEVRSIKKISRGEEKVADVQRTYSGPDYKGKLVLYAAMNTNGKDGNLAITKVERFGRLLNVTVALQDPKNLQTDREDLYQQSVVFLPLKRLPKYGSLRIRFCDTTGHALEDLDVPLVL